MWETITYGARKEAWQNCCKDDILQFVHAVVDPEEVFGVAANCLEVEVGGAGSLGQGIMCQCLANFEESCNTNTQIRGDALRLE